MMCSLVMPAFDLLRFFPVFRGPSSRREELAILEVNLPAWHPGNDLGWHALRYSEGRGALAMSARPEVLRRAWSACNVRTPFGVPQSVPPKRSPSSRHEELAILEVNLPAWPGCHAHG